MAAVDMFADLGIDLYRRGALTDGLELLAQRLDFIGARELVADLLSVDWVYETRGGDKGNPVPVPKPQPTPPPRPSPTTPKGRRR